MIPTRSSRPPVLASPGMTQMDLAKLIHRTVQMAVDAKRELGFAAVNVGCDGRKRTTMFDGSTCQTEGEVCLAERQDGITTCLNTPASGAGLTFQSIAFTAPVCSPVTGWWLVDSEGYMYRVPTALITAAPYWPMSEAPGSSVALLRAGTWERLMCAAALTIPLQGDGGAKWWRSGESDWQQIFSAAIGGEQSQWVTLPSVSITPGVWSAQVDVSGTWAWVLDGIPGLAVGTSSVTLSDSDGYWSMLASGEDYTAALYLEAGGLLQSVKGQKAAIGTSIAPSIPSDSLPVAEAVIVYGMTGSSVTLTADLGGRYGSAWAPVAGFELNAPSWRAVLLRDIVAPNAGFRVATVTLPSAVSGIITGAVRVAYGYPLGSIWGSQPYTYDPPGTPESDCAGIVLGSYAKVYPRQLAVEYQVGHVNLAGGDITDPGSYVGESELDWLHGTALDVAAGVVGLPGGEVALLGAASDIRSGTRYRVRAAPDTAPTVVIEQQAKGTWPDDPNVWTEAPTTHSVAAWLAAATQFTVTGSGAATFPGRAVPCVLWETNGGETYLNAAIRYEAMLGETSGGLTTLAFVGGVSVLASTKSQRYLTFTGTNMKATYGWTCEIDGVESALSPLTDQGIYGYDLHPPSTLYSIKLTIPGAPAVADKRHVYRFAWSGGDAPWSFDSHTIGDGAVYDRMCKRIATLIPDEGNPVDTAYTFYDEVTSLARAGIRPPAPLIYVGPITVEAPLPVHLLQPLNL